MTWHTSTSTNVNINIRGDSGQEPLSSGGNTWSNLQFSQQQDWMKHWWWLPYLLIDNTETEMIWPPFCRRFNFLFLNEKFIYFVFKFVSVLFHEVQLTINNQPSFSKWLGTKRRQAIIWTNADLVCWRLYASLSRNKLRNYDYGTNHCILICEMFGVSITNKRVI